MSFFGKKKSYQAFMYRCWNCDTYARIQIPFGMIRKEWVGPCPNCNLPIDIDGRDRRRGEPCPECDHSRHESPCNHPTGTARCGCTVSGGTTEGSDE